MTSGSWNVALAIKLADRRLAYNSSKARVALARKLAVVLHRMLRDGTNFIARKGASALAA
ncbi:hypothetical protein FQZ97_192340 [compost metagenome]